MKEVLHRADSRGVAEYGWLSSRHTFSFAAYHDPQRVRFGLLRVINDDVVQPARGFDTHPHENMEIISIPLAGALRHHDSMGYTLPASERNGRLQNIVSPDEDDTGVRINQAAWFYLGDFSTGSSHSYTIKQPGNGAYILVLEGAIAIADKQLSRRDGIAIEGLETIDFTATDDCQLLIMDVPVDAAA
jgi:redox-sensitive bicupin YhaK (pirin superfamily)